MRCENIEKLIAAYADGELEGVQKDFVKAHIESCPHCAELYREYLALNDALCACAERAPDDLCDKVMAAVREEKAAPAARSRGILLGRAATWMGVGVAAVLCVSVATTALVRHMAENAGDDIEIGTSAGDRAPEAEGTTAGEHWTLEGIWTDASPDDNVTPEQPGEDITYEDILPDTDAVGTENEEAMPEDSVAESATGSQEPDQDVTKQETTEDGVTGEEATEAATEEQATVAPADTDTVTQPETDATPAPENAPRGWFGRMLEAVGDFFVQIFEAVVSLFGGKSRG